MTPHPQEIHRPMRTEQFQRQSSNSLIRDKSLPVMPIFFLFIIEQPAEINNMTNMTKDTELLTHRNVKNYIFHSF